MQTLQHEIYAAIHKFCLRELVMILGDNPKSIECIIMFVFSSEEITLMLFLGA